MELSKKPYCRGVERGRLYNHGKAKGAQRQQGVLERHSDQPKETQEGNFALWVYVKSNRIIK
jgi:hypothetical protein